MRRSERPLGRVRLRNRIITALNNWQQLGCRVRCGDAFQFKQRHGQREFQYFSRLVIGTKGPWGRAVLIYPHIQDRKFIPKCILLMMMEYEAQGALVGCATNIGDAWDIVFDDPSQYKRKRRTYDYQADFERWQWRLNQKKERDEE